MGKVALRCIALVVAVLFFVQIAIATPVKVPDGTLIQVKLLETLTSGRAQQGAIVRYVVTRDVIVGGQVVIEKGARATGKVITSKRRGMFGKNGRLDFSIESAEAVDGSAIALRAEAKGGSGRSNVTGVILGALFLSVFAVFINGRDITVKEGTEFPAYIDGNPLVELGATATAANVLPNAKFTVKGSTLTEKAVIGEVCNDGPDTASADVIVLIKKDGKQVGAGHALVTDVKAGQVSAFNAEITGSTDGEVTVLTTVKAPTTASPAQPDVPAEDFTILSKVISDKEVVGKVLNNRKDKVDIEVTATCKDGEKIVGTGSVVLKGVAPGESADYVTTIKGKTTSDVTVEAKVK